MYLPTTKSLLGTYVVQQAHYPKASLTKTISKPTLPHVELLIKPLRRHQRHRIGYIAETAIVPISTESQKLQAIVDDSTHTLLNANTVFPFMLFPDSIHIDRQKLTITHRSSYRSAKTISVPLKDILNVEANVGPFFGSLILTSKYFQNNTQSINFLRRKEVIKAQMLLQGYMIAHHEKIDFANIPTPELVIMLNELGQSSKILRSA